MSYPTLYRKRIIPDECVLLKDDEILSYENNILVTKWKTLKPKKDLDHGFSCYFFDFGYKVSKFYDREHNLLYYYCDIIDAKINPNTPKYVLASYLANKYSINFDINTIPINTPIPNIHPINRFCGTFSNLVKSLTTFNIG